MNEKPLGVLSYLKGRLKRLKEGKMVIRVWVEDKEIFANFDNRVMEKYGVSYVF